MSSTLDFTLKKKWFDMILSGEKPEEYREIKPYWHARLWDKDHDLVQFRNGYQAESPKVLMNLRGISKGIGKKEWGAPDYWVFILILGEIVNKD